MNVFFGEIHFVSSKLAKSAIAHIAADGCDDVIKPPFFTKRPEVELLKNPDWAAHFETKIKNALKQNPVLWDPVHRIGIPKDRLTSRSIAQISLSDSLKYLALVLSIAPTIEKARLPPGTVFSNRFVPTAVVKVDRKRWDAFRQRSQILSEQKTNKFKVITDLSNFYDRINLHKLENLLKEVGCDTKIVSKINHLLIQWSEQQSYGIPVGSDASRLLAEAMLINVDRELKQQNVKFIRYVDDFRIFVSSRLEAYEAIQILSAALSREGLFLNSGKTLVIELQHGADEHTEGTPEFELIDPTEKVEHLVSIQTQYTAKIAKYYKYPGKDAIIQLQKLDLNDLFDQASKPNAPEDTLRLFVKASIYAAKPIFAQLEVIMGTHQHLIPYVVDAIEKEMEATPDRFDFAFKKEARKFFKMVFQKYQNTDYFRLQAMRALKAIDKKFPEYVDKWIFSVHATRQILLSQIIHLSGVGLKRITLLKLIENFQSYGSEVRLAIIWSLTRFNIVTDAEKQAKLKYLANHEKDELVLKLMKS